MLDHKFARVLAPFHPRNVVVPRIAGHIQPARVPAARTNHSNSHRRIRGAGNWISDVDERWIGAEPGIWKAGDDRARRSQIVNQRKNRDSARVKLPVSDLASVRTPAEAIAQRELFFVYPVGRSVDDCVRPVARELSDMAVSQ